MKLYAGFYKSLTGRHEVEDRPVVLVSFRPTVEARDREILWMSLPASCFRFFSIVQGSAAT